MLLQATKRSSLSYSENASEMLSIATESRRRVSRDFPEVRFLDLYRRVAKHAKRLRHATKLVTAFCGPGCQPTCHLRRDPSSLR